ncbi:NADH-quinone oxidoreductase subunit NuoH [Georgenia subflava]|uniref:NADH-quinone oxidoreductase subunit H n=1 Tax=Georgenia subflava TaxID=1622177 RepID=A0A6N7EK37_9MICO|nr:NADH-quinone oxidoreductase subunit NuoH [Georgenia subflava]MPV37771.1 NADH-quinone oxidoreductase subunit NuoH [Georgenia subflava]
MAAAAPTADFSNDTWWIWVIKAVAILVFLLVSVLMALWVERRGLGRMQTRPGPNVHGPLGLLQAVGDALKLVLKEDFTIKGADKFVYALAPFIASFCAFLVLAVIPFGPEVSIFGVVTPLQLTDTPVAVLYFLAVTALGVYGIVLGGWASNSTYPLLGSVRSAAQIISYELSMGLSLVSVILVSGSLSTSQIVSAQTQLWWAIALAPAFVVYLVSMVGEVNRLPFDLPEAEGELVAGHMVEYTSMKFAWFFLAEYINMFNVSAVATTLFLGGWRAPWPLSSIGDGVLNTGWWPVLWFIAKMWLVMFLMIWTRGTLLRFRYDQFMKLGWKILIPVALVWLVLVAVVQGVRQFTETDLSTMLLWIGGVFAVLMVVLLLWPAKKEEAEEPRTAHPDLIPPGGEFDAFAGGYPVPPLPGQTLPPSPRRTRRESAGVGGPQSTPKEGHDV